MANQDTKDFSQTIAEVIGTRLPVDPTQKTDVDLLTEIVKQGLVDRGIPADLAGSIHHERTLELILEDTKTQAEKNDTIRELPNPLSVKPTKTTTELANIDQEINAITVSTGENQTKARKSLNVENVQDLMIGNTKFQMVNIGGSVKGSRTSLPIKALLIAETIAETNLMRRDGSLESHYCLKIKVGDCPYCQGAIYPFVKTISHAICTCPACRELEYPEYVDNCFYDFLFSYESKIKGVGSYFVFKIGGGINKEDYPKMSYDGKKLVGPIPIQFSSDCKASFEKKNNWKLDEMPLNIFREQFVKEIGKESINEYMRVHLLCPQCGLELQKPTSQKIDAILDKKGKPDPHRCPGCEQVRLLPDEPGAKIIVHKINGTFYVIRKCKCGWADTSGFMCPFFNTGQKRQTLDDIKSNIDTRFDLYMDMANRSIRQDTQNNIIKSHSVWYDAIMQDKANPEKAKELATKYYAFRLLLSEISTDLIGGNLQEKDNSGLTLFKGTEDKSSMEQMVEEKFLSSGNYLLELAKLEKKKFPQKDLVTLFEQVLDDKIVEYLSISRARVQRRLQLFEYSGSLRNKFIRYISKAGVPMSQIEFKDMDPADFELFAQFDYYLQPLIDKNFSAARESFKTYRNSLHASTLSDFVSRRASKLKIDKEKVEEISNKYSYTFPLMGANFSDKAYQAYKLESEDRIYSKQFNLKELQDLFLKILLGEYTFKKFVQEEHYYIARDISLEEHMSEVKKTEQQDIELEKAIKQRNKKIQDMLSKKNEDELDITFSHINMRFEKYAQQLSVLNIFDEFTVVLEFISKEWIERFEKDEVQLAIKIADLLNDQARKQNNFRPIFLKDYIRRANIIGSRIVYDTLSESKSAKYLNASLDTRNKFLNKAIVRIIDRYNKDLSYQPNNELSRFRKCCKIEFDSILELNQLDIILQVLTTNNIEITSQNLLNNPQLLWGSKGQRILPQVMKDVIYYSPSENIGDFISEYNVVDYNYSTDTYKLLEKGVKVPQVKPKVEPKKQIKEEVDPNEF